MKGGWKNSESQKVNFSSNLSIISIITIVFNGEKSIENTIKSIINQDYQNVEYIIIDGNSSDKTLEIIQKYDSKIAYWISEPDKGLYDAMNKGLHAATGDYVWFINSGDLVFSESTLTSIFQNKTELSDIYYGETQMIDEQGNEIGLRRLKAPKTLTWKSFKNGMLVSHQSILVKRSIAENYDLSYRYSADFDWVIKVLKNANLMTNTALMLSKFLDGGQTKQTIIPGLKERFRIMSKNYGFIPTFFRHIIIGLKFVFFVSRHKRF